MVQRTGTRPAATTDPARAANVSCPPATRQGRLGSCRLVLGARSVYGGAADAEDLPDLLDRELPGVVALAGQQDAAETVSAARTKGHALIQAGRREAATLIDTAQTEVATAAENYATTLDPSPAPHRGLPHPTQDNSPHNRRSHTDR